MKTSRGFTLIELVATIGLIVVLTVGSSLAFRREGNAGVALRAAEREIVSALRLARSAAQARQLPVRLAVLATPAPGEDANETGRRWWLLRADGTGWVGLHPAGELPAGTCLVPSDLPALRLRAGVVWRSALLSQLEAPVPWEGGMMSWLEFSPDGKLVGGPRRMVLAVTEEAPGQSPRLVDSAAVRVVQIMADGRIEEVAP